jgi:hypothetical protein
LENFFKINRIDDVLKKSIYSKSYFSKSLKKQKICNLDSKNLSSPNKLENDFNVIKPDAPIFGKKNIYKIFKNENYSKKFDLCKNESHNKKVNISNYYEGVDISSFYLVDNKRKIIDLIAHTQEFNNFTNSKIINIGICSPPIFNKNIIILKKFKIDKKIIKQFSNFYGIISITSKINHLDNEILPYEINIGLSGDQFADTIFPHLFKRKSLYSIEINLSLLKIKNNFTHKSNRFIGFLNKKKYISKSYFFNQINKLYKTV